MAVSLTQVQAAVSGHNPTGAAGPLTLNVLHKTDGLLTKLLALDTAKPHTVQVLNGQANGRAQVQVGGLQLDVKSSLPLKAGDVFQLKFEQVGSALRFVQPPLTETSGKPVPTGVDAKGQAAQQGLAAGRAGGLPAQTLVQSPLGTTSQGHQQGGQPQSVTTTGAPAVNGQAGKANAPGLQTTNAPLATVKTTPLPTGQNGVVVAKAATANAIAGAQSPASGVQTPSPTSLSVSPILATQTTTTALIRAVAEVLPEVLRKEDGNRGPAQKGAAQKDGGTRFAAGGQTGGATGSAALRPAPETVNASYKAIGQAVEEVQEIKGLPQRPAEMTLDLGASDGQRPGQISLYLDRDDHPNQDGAPDKGYGVRFSLETEETGAVYAEMSLRNELVRLGLWAERDEIAEQIQEALPILEERLEATGFVVGGIFVRHGPAPLEELASDHVDEQI